MKLAEIGFCQANNDMEFKLGNKGKKGHQESEIQ